MGYKKEPDKFSWRIILSTAKAKFRTVYSDNGGLIANVYGRTHTERDLRTRLVSLLPDFIELVKVLNDKDPELIKSTNPKLAKELDYIIRKIELIKQQYADHEKAKETSGSSTKGEKT